MHDISPLSTAPALTSTFGRRLDAEWARLRTSRRALQVVPTWAGPDDQPFDRMVRSVVDLDEIVVAAAWMAVRRYDTATRPRHVAATLISDAIFQAFRKPLRRRSATEVPRSPDHFVRDAGEIGRPHAFLELADVVRTAGLAGVDDGHLELIRHLVRTGSPGVTAADCGVTPRPIRNRRDRAVDSIREALAAA